MFNRTTLVILIAAVAAGLGLWASQKHFGAAPAEAWPPTQAVRLFDPPRALPDFSLRQSDGTQLVPGELKGHWTLVFLGFTHCPDVCPLTLSQLSQAQKQWETIPEAIRPRVLFVSVDPERDSAKLADDYARHFTDAATGVTADHDRLTPFTRALGMVYMTSPLDDGGYSVDHSVSVAVIDPDTRLVAQLRPPLDAQRIAADLHTLMDVRR